MRVTDEQMDRITIPKTTLAQLLRAVKTVQCYVSCTPGMQRGDRNLFAHSAREKPHLQNCGAAPVRWNSESKICVQPLKGREKGAAKSNQISHQLQKKNAPRLNVSVDKINYMSWKYYQKDIWNYYTVSQKGCHFNHGCNLVNSWWICKILSLLHRAKNFQQNIY